jgi:serine/threonine-protein kinase
MERLYGQDLAAFLQQVPRMPLADVLDLVRQVGAGLDAAHKVGIVHRDLKPQNVFRAEVLDRLVWKVLDFGVCKLLETGGTLTRGLIVGTPQYMAPEQARGDVVDHRADLYALSLIAYRALTGRPPFIVADMRALIAVTASTMPPRPSAVCDLPRALDDVLAVAISKDPGDRFDSAQTLYDALCEAAVGKRSQVVSQRAAAVLERWPWADPAREGPPAL